MANFQKTLVTIFFAIVIAVASVFVYEYFIRNNDDVNESKVETLENKIKSYEKEITGYREDLNQRSKHIDSLESVKNILLIENESLKTQIAKIKSNRNETVHNLNGADANELYKLFSNYKPKTIN